MTRRSMSDEAREQIAERRRARVEERLIDKFDAADALIGELCREGQPVFYVYPVGGKYREGSRADLAEFLIRNRYV